MTEAARIILTLSDAELVLFHGMGGKVPDQLKSRLSDLLTGVQVELLPVKVEPKMRGPQIVYPTRGYASRKMKRRKWSYRVRIAA
jgi:hypothetical protein